MVITRPRSWRPYALPAACLGAATLAVFGIRALVGHSQAPPSARPGHAQPARKHVTPAHKAARYWVVRAGDTLAAVAARTGVPMARLLELNPKLQPTALFIGQKIRIR
jgi:hypothetical protein